MKAEYARVLVIKFELEEIEAKMLRDMMQNPIIPDESSACAKLREEIFTACKVLEL